MRTLLQMYLLLFSGANMKAYFLPGRGCGTLKQIRIVDKVADVGDHKECVLVRDGGDAAALEESVPGTFLLKL